MRTTAREHARGHRREPAYGTDEFLAHLAHELRNPLAPIRAAAEVLQASRADSEVERARAIIVRQIDHMVRIVDDLLDVSRITNDKISLRIAPVDLDEVIDAALETTQPLITTRRHFLSVARAEAPARLDGDLSRLAQALAALLTNAAKFTPPGGTIHVSAALERDTVAIKVADTGIGIDPRVLPVIFEPFVQGDQPEEWTTSGLGIGLTLARRLVEMHGGVLEASSGGYGQGATFTMTLPLTDTIAPRNGNTTAAPGALPVEQRRVLVVDDNEDAAEMLAALVSAWGHVPRVAHDGLDAIDVARTFQPDIVLLDLGLPRVNGFDTARRMREEQWSRSTFIVAVTGWGRDTDRERTREAGFDEHLVKPVSMDALREILARPLARHQTAQAG